MEETVVYIIEEANWYDTRGDTNGWPCLMYRNIPNHIMV